MFDWVKRVVRKLDYKQDRGIEYVNSADYWEDRYQRDRNSGAGSYGRLAIFKSDTINAFVSEMNIESVVELGVGDGNQLSLANYPKYLGLDVSGTIIKRCRAKFKEDKSKRFMEMQEFNADKMRAELSLSLDVIYHLVEDEVFEKYVRQLFDVASRYVIIYSSDYDESFAKHIRHRHFTKWISQNLTGVRLIRKINNKYPYNKSDPEHTSFSDFFIYKKVSVE